MSRSRLAYLLIAVFSSSSVIACSKPAANQDTGQKPVPTEGQRVMVPGAEPATGAPRMTMGAPGAEGGAAPAQPGADPFQLQPSEGTLVIEAPADVKAGTEAVARVLVTPGSAYKINTEFPTKLTLESAAGVTLAKAQLVAGGADKAKGDAESFDDKQLAFQVKLTPTQGGPYAVNGTFKFAVCDKDTCLAKKETIRIAGTAN